MYAVKFNEHKVINTSLILKVNELSLQKIMHKILNRCLPS